MSLELQFLLDKYGYVIFGCKCPRAIGEVIHGVRVGPLGRDRPDITVVVTGFASIDEWRKQCVDAYGAGIFDEEKARAQNCIIKAVAE